MHWTVKIRDIMQKLQQNPERQCMWNLFSPNTNFVFSCVFLVCNTKILWEFYFKCKDVPNFHGKLYIWIMEKALLKRHLPDSSNAQSHEDILSLIAFVCPYKKESIVNTLIFGIGNNGLKYNDIYSITYSARVNREVVFFFTRASVTNNFFLKYESIRN